MYRYICLKCTQFLKINAGNSLSVHLHLDRCQSMTAHPTVLQIPPHRHLDRCQSLTAHPTVLPIPLHPLTDYYWIPDFQLNSSIWCRFLSDWCSGKRAGLSTGEVGSNPV